MSQNGRIPCDAGTVGILNVGDGDTKLSFDPNNPAERIRAARIVRDMLRRGYALLVEVDVGGEKRFMRATDFREDVCEYVIADLDPIAAAAADAEEPSHDQQDQAQQGAAPTAGAETAPRRRGRPPSKRAIPAESTRAVVVARVAGG